MLDEKVDRLQTILEIDDSALASTLLDDSGWDIELAVENYFNSQASSTESAENTGTSATPARLPISPSIAHVGLGSGRSAQAGSFIWTIWRGILWLAIKILRLPLWLYSFLFNQSDSYTPPQPVPQEEAHSLLLSSIDEAVNSREPSSSSTAISRTTQRQKTHVTPSLYLGTYGNALRDVKNNSQFGIIAFIDSSTTSDDFKYHTLAENQFNKLVNEHDCLVWVGDISTNRDAYDVAMTKGINVFPRVEVHSMQALPTSRNALVSVPTMSHLGSISGKDSLGEAFRNLLTSRYLNRVSPYLRRLRNEKYEKQRATYIKEAADRAENERMQRDAENVLKKREESARSVKAAEESAQQREKEENEKADNEVILNEYRNWLKSTLPSEPADGIRLAFKLPDGRRVIRKFSPETSFETLYMFVDTIDVEMSTKKPTRIVDFEPEFKLYMSYPCEFIPNLSDRLISQSQNLIKGGIIAVESDIKEYSSDEEDYDEV